MTFMRCAVAFLVASMIYINVCQAANAQFGGGGDQGWQTMNMPGSTLSFQMPKPIKMNENQKEGMVVYIAKKPQQKESFRVGIVKRNFEQDQAKGMNDDTVLQNFALRILAGNKLTFKKMGYPYSPKLVANLNKGNIKGQQYQGKVGKASILTRFYINKQGLYYVEVTTQNLNSPDINRFLNSFTL